MCGIAGWMNDSHGPRDASPWAVAMANCLTHRGPDDSGVFQAPEAGVALAHRRLSIIDLSQGSHQPMADSATGVVLAYNGELYNFRDIRAQLQALGHVFASSGDTEVVLRAYIQWGVECFARFAGMFALALWDPRSATVHLARDAMGMKPLYLAPMRDGVAFASEVKAFRALPGFVGTLEPSGVQQFLEFGYIFLGRGTSLSGVEKVLPGERVELRGGAIAARHNWFTHLAPDAADRRSEAERVEELAHVMQTVVAEHLIADVPVGLLLSGGLDSSVVAALAAGQGPLTTITMGFGQSDVDERGHARQVADHIDSRHVDVLIDPQQVRDEVASGAWVFDDLFADWGTITTRLLYRRCREMGLKVVLVGEGADELFGGYDIFNLPPRLGLWQQFQLYRRYAGRRHGRLFGAFREVMQGNLQAGHGDPFHAVRLFESRRQLPNNYVMKVDKASMAESVEARAPYLDRRVAELAYRTPGTWLRRGGENKYLLRALGRRQGLLPPAISARPKFGAPLAASWMDDDASFRSFARDHMLADGSQTQRLGLSHLMRDYFDHGHAGQRWPGPVSVYRNLAWRLLLLELWAPHYLGTTPRQTGAAT